MRGALKGVLVVLAMAIAVAVLFTWVFPWFEARYVTDPTLALTASP